MATNMQPWQPTKGVVGGQISTNLEIMSDEKVGEGHRKKSWGTRFHGNQHVVMATKKTVFL